MKLVNYNLCFYHSPSSIINVLAIVEMLHSARYARCKRGKNGGINYNEAVHWTVRNANFSLAI